MHRLIVVLPPCGLTLSYEVKEELCDVGFINAFKTLHRQHYIIRGTTALTIHMICSCVNGCAIQYYEELHALSILPMRGNFSLKNSTSCGSSLVHLPSSFLIKKIISFTLWSAANNMICTSWPITLTSYVDEKCCAQILQNLMVVSAQI